MPAGFLFLSGFLPFLLLEVGLSKWLYIFPSPLMLPLSDPSGKSQTKGNFIDYLPHPRGDEAKADREPEREEEKREERGV